MRYPACMRSPRPALPALLILAALLAACTGKPDEETAAPEDTDEPEEREDCTTLEIRIDGEDPPVVGETWTTFLVCDDALLLGAMRVLWDPADIASVNENTSTFLRAGEADLTVQTGSRRVTRAVTVGE